jgi:hypothetical protein
VRNLSDTTSASTLDNSRWRSWQTLERREPLLVDVVGKSPEKVVETTSRWNVRIDSQTWADIHPFDGLKVVHLVRDILAVIEVIDGLAMWVSICDGRPVLKRRNSLLGSKVVVTDAPTERRVNRTKTESVRAHTGGSARRQIRVETSHLVRGFHRYSGCRRRIRLAESLTRKHKTDNCC